MRSEKSSYVGAETPQHLDGSGWERVPYLPKVLLITEYLGGTLTSDTSVQSPNSREGAEWTVKMVASSMTEDGSLLTDAHVRI